METMKAIETVYKGYRFRSRLEARWAVVFDTLGVKWEYEKEGFDLGDGIYYLPDFWLPKQALWVEVKGVPKAEDHEKLWRLHELSKSDVVLVAEIPDDPEHTPHIYGSIEIDIELNDAEHERAFHRMFASDPRAYYGEMNVNCPVCGFEYVHIGEVKDEGIRMYCEGNHSWTLVFSFHKGITQVFIRDIIETNGHLAVVLAEGDKELARRALLAGRQARFEHGETPGGNSVKSATRPKPIAPHETPIGRAAMNIYGIDRFDD